MLTEKQFEDLMNRRHIEPPSYDFAERIIAAAQERVEYSITGIMAYLRGVIESVLPKPSYAFALMLVAGVVIGASLPAQNPNEVSAIEEEESIL